MTGGFRDRSQSEARPSFHVRKSVRKRDGLASPGRPASSQSCTSNREGSRAFSRAAGRHPERARPAILSDRVPCSHPQVAPPTGRKRNARSDIDGVHATRHKQLEEDAYNVCLQRSLLALPAKKLCVRKGKWVSTMPRGFPDLYIFDHGQEAGAVRHALAVEFKIGEDTLKPEQEQWEHDLSTRSIRYVPCPKRLQPGTRAAQGDATEWRTCTCGCSQACSHQGHRELHGASRRLRSAGARRGVGLGENAGG